MVKLACPACCGKYFDSRAELRIHLAASSENVCCPECHKKFPSVVELINHLNGECLDDSVEQQAPDPTVVVDLLPSSTISESPKLIDSEATVVEGEITGTHIVLSAEGAAEINVENYIPIGIVAKEEPELNNENNIEGTEDEVQYYYCSSCQCNIDSIIDHITIYHPNETVEYEGTELTASNNPVSVSDLTPETIINDMVGVPETDEIPVVIENVNDVEEWTYANQGANGSPRPTNKIIERSLPRNPEELRKFLEENSVFTETSPEEILYDRPKRPPRQYVEKEVLDKDGNVSIVYSCENCSREFRDLSKFKLHRCPSQGPKLKVCPVCEEGFQSPVDFINHFRMKHPNYKQEKVAPREFVQKMVKERDSESLVSGVSCTRCSRDFFDASAWKLHKCTVPAHLHKECPICFKKFVIKRNYTMHLHNHGLKHMARLRLDGSSSHSFMCVKCDRNFENRLFFQLHKCIEGEVKAFECGICSSKLSTKVGLNSHMRMHKPEEEKRAWKLKQKARLLRESKLLTPNVFACPICEERISTRDKDIHMKMHQGELFCCPVKSCNKNFASQEQLENHKQIHIENPMQNFVHTCYYCHQRFMEKDLFLEHIKKHNTPARSYQCTYCGRGFSKPNERIKHEWVHTGKQPYVCTTCGMRFRKSFCLLTHERIHTGYRPYTCDTCGKSFRTRSAFTHHLRIHSDIRMFHCKICPKTFKTAVQLANHRNSHTKPFTCNLCNRRFINSYSMRRHVRRHPTFEHFCQLCGAAYGRPFELRDHMIESHGRPKSPSMAKRKSTKQTALDEHSYDALDDS